MARDLLALVLAAAAAYLAFLIASGGPSTLEEIGPYATTGLWYVGPSILIVSAVLAPIFIVLRRRGFLSFWVVLALYALYPLAISAGDLGTDFGASSVRAALVYLASGLAAGITYWAVAVLPSNPALNTDAGAPRRAG
jgi:hypothetical protein